MSKSSLLILGRGDSAYSDRNGECLFEYAKNASLDVQFADYHNIGELVDFENGDLNVMFFFPHTFWNTCCENPEDIQLYGTSKDVYGKFSRFFLSVQGRLEQRFHGKRLHYVIPPENAALDRDKIQTHQRLRACDIPTPETIHYHSLKDILTEVTVGRGVFIKCRYGAEGKGITVLHHNKWVTNYQVEANILSNYGVHDKWPFADVTGRTDLLEQILRHEVIVEREIMPPDKFGGKKFDVRVYVVEDNVPHFFVRLNDPEKETTSFSQGATILHNPETGLEPIYVEFLKKQAKKAAQAMGSRFLGVDIM
ncbi:hypothetical protein KA005_77910, partial [bacterium]|nr:hypothetical protein [bacterium]